MSFTVEAEFVYPPLLPRYFRILVRGPERNEGHATVELIVDSAKCYWSQSLFGETMFHLTRTGGRIGRSECTVGDQCFLNREQGGKCNGCSQDLSTAKVELDHYIPTAYGGPDVMSNWQLLCQNCNRIKGDRRMAYLVSVLVRRYPEMLHSHNPQG